ncbi:MAG: YbhN family protein [Paracoccaceae bacterium]
MTRRQGLIALFRVAVAAILVAVLSRHVDLRGAFAILSGIDPLWLLPAAGLFLLGQTLSCLRWRIALAQIVEVPPPFPALLKLYFIGMFVNLGIPTTAGGDVVRAEMMRGMVGGRGGAYASILADRIIGALAVVLLACGAAVLARGVLDAETRRMAAFAALAAPVAIAALVWSVGYLGRNRVAGRVAPFLDALRLLGRRPSILALSLCIALVVQTVGVVLPISLLAHAMSIELPLSAHFVLVPIIVLATLIPVAPNGLGLRETAFVILYAPFGVPHEAAAALGFSWSLLLTVFGLAGGIALASWTGAEPASRGSKASAR